MTTEIKDKDNSDKKAEKKLIVVLLIIYILSMVWIILFKMSIFSEVFGMERIRSINLIPFHYDEETPYHLSEVMMNVLIFAPLGIYLKILDIKNIKIIITGIVISLLFEILQSVFAIGASDITDVITNSAGTIMGVISYGILRWISKDKVRPDRILILASLICTVMMLILFTVLIISNI